MENIIDLHDDIMFFLIFILIFVFFIVYILLEKYSSYFTPLNRSSLRIERHLRVAFQHHERLEQF